MPCREQSVCSPLETSVRGAPARSRDRRCHASPTAALCCADLCPRVLDTCQSEGPGWHPRGVCREDNWELRRSAYGLSTTDGCCELTQPAQPRQGLRSDRLKLGRVGIHERPHESGEIFRHLRKPTAQPSAHVASDDGAMLLLRAFLL